MTAARSGEARFSTWDEIDFEARTWTVPAKRMKMAKEHTVPLSDRAYNILVHMDAHRFGDYIFSHPSSGKAFSVNATIMLIRRLDYGKLTTHGFRSTFRDWAGDKTMHQMLMQDWADYCYGA